MSRHKYPRTFHLPFSPGASSDDKVLAGTGHLDGQDVVVTLKMDGENTSLYADGFHARSLDSRHHPSRDWLARFHASLAHVIPPGWRICGENLYARHAIAYHDLPSYFLGFSIWDGDNRCLPWDETVELLGLLGVHPVPVLWRGPFDARALERLAGSLDTSSQEGLVVRLAAGFAYEAFGHSVAKWVRQAHVQTDGHWIHAAVVPNTLAPAAPEPRP
jgi:hypothetical protein